VTDSAATIRSRLHTMYARQLLNQSGTSHCTNLERNALTNIFQYYADCVMVSYAMLMY